MSALVREIEETVFETEVLGSATPVVLDFYSTECPPCEALAPKYDALAELYGHDLRFVKIFRQGNRALSDKLGVRSSPTVLFFRGGQEVGKRLTGGIRRSELAAELDALVPAERAAAIHAAVKPVETSCDVLILGGGPAGITAGIYAAQAKLDTIMVDVGLGGGNLTVTHQVSNFPGFPKPQPGYMLAHHLLEHAKAAGVKGRFAAELTRVDLRERVVVLDGVETIRAKKIIVATGSSPRTIGVAGEVEYKGKGVSYCATCDAKYYEGKHVVVIGGGNSAIEESLFIAKFASKITVVHQFAELQANKHAQEQAFANEKIGFLFEHEPRAFVASDGKSVDSVVVEDLRTHEQKTLACDGVFVFAGMKPNLEGFGTELELDRFGYVKVDEEMRTSIPGVYAAGDIVSKRYRQMTTAVSDGTIASIALSRDLAA
ncbi:MAG: FAD-dependent oxidoreductase [Myxococcales bacterium]|nr:FAD-dependent oxidoreductase [Myxococcales bacterium]